jgi:hypothetical protein
MVECGWGKKNFLVSSFQLGLGVSVKIFAYLGDFFQSLAAQRCIPKADLHLCKPYTVRSLDIATHYAGAAPRTSVQAGLVEVFVCNCEMKEESETRARLNRRS